MTSGTVLPSQLPKEQKLGIAAAYYAAYVLLGLMLTAIGPALDALKKQSSSSTEAIALLFTASSLGYITGSLLAGRWYARLAGHRVLTAALLYMCLLTVAIPWLGSLWLLMVVFALIGISLGLIDVGGNTLMVWLYRQDVPPYMNALHLFFGLGAFSGPLVIDRFAVATGNAATTFWLFAGLMVPVALWLARLPSPDRPLEGEPAAGGLRSLRRHFWLIGLIALFFFMHMGAELAFGGWIFSYAEEAIGSETTARIVNSAFWGGLVIGRLISIPLAWRLSPRGMLQVDLVGAAASLGLIILLPDWTPALWIGTIGFGVFVASMIPASFNFAAERMPITSQVSSAFLVGGSLGSMLLPWVVGQLFDSQGRLWTMYVTGMAVVAAALLFGTMLASGRRIRPAEEPAADATVPRSP